MEQYGLYFCVVIIGFIIGILLGRYYKKKRIYKEQHKEDLALKKEQNELNKGFIN